ncbi:unnamed protein product [Cochlearia groenlandica]
MSSNRKLRTRRNEIEFLLHLFERLEKRRRFAFGLLKSWRHERFLGDIFLRSSMDVQEREEAMEEKTTNRFQRKRRWRRELG